MIAPIKIFVRGQSLDVVRELCADDCGLMIQAENMLGEE